MHLVHTTGSPALMLVAASLEGTTGISTATWSNTRTIVSSFNLHFFNQFAQNRALVETLSTPLSLMQLA